MLKSALTRLMVCPKCTALQHGTRHAAQHRSLPRARRTVSPLVAEFMDSEAEEEVHSGLRPASGPPALIPPRSSSCFITDVGFHAQALNRPLRDLIGTAPPPMPPDSHPHAAASQAADTHAKPKPAVYPLRRHAPPSPSTDMGLLLWLRLNSATLGSYFSPFPQTPQPADCLMAVTRWQVASNTLELVTGSSWQQLSEHLWTLSQQQLRVPPEILAQAKPLSSATHCATLKIAEALLPWQDFLPPSVAGGADASADRLVLFPWRHLRLETVEGTRSPLDPPLRSLASLIGQQTLATMALEPWRPLVAAAQQPSSAPVRLSPQLVSAFTDMVASQPAAISIPDKGHPLPMTLQHLPVWTVLTRTSGEDKAGRHKNSGGKLAEIERTRPKIFEVVNQSCL